MGYTTEFRGTFTCSRTLNQAEIDFLKKFSETRHGGNCDVDEGYPGFWCEWVPTSDGTGIEWDGCEKFYDYVDWLVLLISLFFEPKGIVLNGRVRWRGEDFDDNGTIVVENNETTTETFERTSSVSYNVLPAMTPDMAAQHKAFMAL